MEDLLNTTAPEGEPQAPESAPEAPAAPEKEKWWRLRWLGDGHVLALTWILFLAAAAVWGLMITSPRDGGPLRLADMFPRRLLIYPDELLYWRLARGIGTGTGLAVYETPVYYGKIGYSLVLAPLFRLGDAHLRAVLAGWINAVMICSSVFPARRIARRITSSRPAQLACVLVTAASPYFALSMTYLTENLFMPLFLWLILAYLALADDMERDLPAGRLAARAALTGVLAFATVMVKDAGLALTAAFCVLTVVRAVRDGKGARRALIAVLPAHAAALLVCLVLKTVFLSATNSYAHQVSPDNLNSLYNAEYFLYAILRTAPFYLLSLMILPVLWPLAVARRNLNRRGRDRLLFLTLALVFILVSISFAISVRESLGKRDPIIHTRYLAGLLPVFTALMLEAMRAPTDRAQRRTFLGLAVAAALMLAFMGPLEGGTRVFYPDLRFYQDLAGLLPVTPTGKKEIAEIAQGPLILALGWLLLIAVPMLVCLARRRQRAAAAIMVAAILGANVYSGFALTDNYRTGFLTDKEKVEDAIALDAWLAEHAQGENVLIIRENWKSYECTATDAWLTVPFRATHYADLAKLLDADGRVNLAEHALRSGMTHFRDASEEYYPAGMGFRYVIVGYKAGIDPSCGEKAAEFPDIRLTVWRLYDPWTLRVTKLGDEYPKKAD
ncbi:MAG: hypothetical protein IKP10_04320 [Clostridia bacterium]|nr:hypothetical protein [Clostridia bacterium]